MDHANAALQLLGALLTQPLELERAATTTAPTPPIDPKKVAERLNQFNIVPSGSANENDIAEISTIFMNLINGLASAPTSPPGVLNCIVGFVTNQPPP